MTGNESGVSGSGSKIIESEPEVNFSFQGGDWAICLLKNLACDIQHQSLTRVEMQLEDIPILIRLTFMSFFLTSNLGQSEQGYTDQLKRKISKPILWIRSKER